MKSSFQMQNFNMLQQTTSAPQSGAPPSQLSSQSPMNFNPQMPSMPGFNLPPPMFGGLLPPPPPHMQQPPPQMSQQPPPPPPPQSPQSQQQQQQSKPQPLMSINLFTSQSPPSNNNNNHQQQAPPQQQSLLGNIPGHHPRFPFGMNQPPPPQPPPPLSQGQGFNQSLPPPQPPNPLMNNNVIPPMAFMPNFASNAPPITIPGPPLPDLSKPPPGFGPTPPSPQVTPQSAAINYASASTPVPLMQQHLPPPSLLMQEDKHFIADIPYYSLPAGLMLPAIKVLNFVNLINNL